MGGHGGLNILPQKKWNVYNFENREKVRKDEEAAAKEEQLKREQSRRRDAEFRLEQLRQAKGLASAQRPSSPSSPVRADPGHINLFDGLEGFSALSGGASRSKDGEAENRKGRKEEKGFKRKREEKPVVVAPEDEKYRMGYGVAGKGVKAPWYLSHSNWTVGDELDGNEREQDNGRQKNEKASGKKTIEELREERLKREKREKERADALLASMRKKRHGSFRR